MNQIIKVIKTVVSPTIQSDFSHTLKKKNLGFKMIFEKYSLFYWQTLFRILEEEKHLHEKQYFGKKNVKVWSAISQKVSPNEFAVT